jgi:hypothetical protein
MFRIPRGHYNGQRAGAEFPVELEKLPAQAAADRPGLCARVGSATLRVFQAIGNGVGEVFRRLWHVAKIIVISVAVASGFVLFITFIALASIFHTLRGNNIFRMVREQRQNVANNPFAQILGNQMGFQANRRRNLDEAINRMHFHEKFEYNIPPVPNNVNLNDLKSLYAGNEIAADARIDLTRFVENVKKGCEGLVGCPAPNTPEAEQFKTRIQKLVGHVLYQLQNGEHDADVKMGICQGFQDAGGACAPRHMEEAQTAYERLKGIEPVDTRGKVIQITQRFRTEIVDRLTQQRGGSIHARTGILQAVGGEFGIPGYNAQDDVYANQVDIREIKELFHSLYTADTLVERFSVAINNSRSSNREIPRQEIIDWLRDNWLRNKGIEPNAFNIEQNAEQWGEYLTDEVYTEDMSAVKPEAIRHMLVEMRVLNAPVPA